VRRSLNSSKIGKPTQQHSVDWKSILVESSLYERWFQEFIVTPM
jgi:hypothetical protein